MLQMASIHICSTRLNCLLTILPFKKNMSLLKTDTVKYLCLINLCFSSNQVLSDLTFINKLDTLNSRATNSPTFTYKWKFINRGLTFYQQALWCISEIKKIKRDIALLYSKVFKHYKYTLNSLGWIQTDFLEKLNHG